LNSHDFLSIIMKNRQRHLFRGEICIKWQAQQRGEASADADHPGLLNPMAWSTASANRLVPAVPPTSRVSDLRSAYFSF
jgi:hypothetical protein